METYELYDVRDVLWMAKGRGSRLRDGNADLCLVHCPTLMAKGRGSRLRDGNRKEDLAIQ